MGDAATSAVVTAIVGIIVSTAIITIITSVLGIWMGGSDSIDLHFVSVKAGN